MEECRLCPVFARFTLAFALQLRKKHGKTSVRARKTSAGLGKTSVRVQYTYFQNTHTLQNPHRHTHTLQNPPTHTHTHTHTHTQITRQYKTTTVQIKTNAVHIIEATLLWGLYKKVADNKILSKRLETPTDKVLRPRRLESAATPLWESKISRRICTLFIA